MKRERAGARDGASARKSYVNNEKGLEASLEGAKRRDARRGEGRMGWERDGGARGVCRDANAKTDDDGDGTARCGVDFKWTHKAKWIDHMTITGTNEERVVDVNDDLTRETFFLRASVGERERVRATVERSRNSRAKTG